MKDLKKGCPESPSKEPDNANQCPKQSASGKCQCASMKDLNAAEIQQAILDYNNSLFGNLRQ